VAGWAPLLGRVLAGRRVGRSLACSRQVVLVAGFVVFWLIGRDLVRWWRRIVRAATHASRAPSASGSARWASPTLDPRASAALSQAPTGQAGACPSLMPAATTEPYWWGRLPRFWSVVGFVLGEPAPRAGRSPLRGPGEARSAGRRYAPGRPPLLCPTALPPCSPQPLTAATKPHPQRPTPHPPSVLPRRPAATPSLPAAQMPVPTIRHRPQLIRRPHHHMRRPRMDLVVAPRAAVRLRGLGGAHVADQPLAVRC
jgi:hypothetical protein